MRRFPGNLKSRPAKALRGQAGRGFRQLLAYCMMLALLASACADTTSSTTSTTNAITTSTSGGTTTVPEETTTSGDPVDTGPIQIGFLGDLSGATAGLGLAGKAGAETAAHEINEAGGVGGRQLELTFYDTQSDPAVGGSVTRDALAAEPVVMTGTFNSQILSGIIPLIQGSDVPWVVTATTTGLDDLPLFTTSESAETSAAVAVEFLFGSLTDKRLVYIGAATSNTDVRADAASATMTAGGGVMSQHIRLPLAVTSFTSEAARLVQDNPDAIAIGHIESAVSVIGQALKVAGYTGPIVSESVASSDTLLQAVDLPNFYVARTNGLLVEGAPIYTLAEAAGASVADGGANPAYFMREYSGVHAIAAALEECGAPCPPADFFGVLRALGDIEVPNGANAGPLNWESSYNGLNTAQLWKWDPDQGMSVPEGPPFNFS